MNKFVHIISFTRFGAIAFCNHQARSLTAPFRQNNRLKHQKLNKEAKGDRINNLYKRRSQISQGDHTSNTLQNAIALTWIQKC